MTIPLPDVGASTSSTSAVPLINDSVVPPYVGNVTDSSFAGDILGYKASDIDDNLVPSYS